MTIYLTPPSGGGAANVSSGTTGSEGTVRLATTVEAQDVNNETLAVTTAEIENRWRAKFGDIAGVKEIKFFSKQRMGGETDIGFRMVGKNPQMLQQAAEELADYLRSMEGVYEVSSSYNEGPQELKLRVKESAEPTGLTLSDLARQVREAFFGAEAQRFQRGNDEIRVMVRYPREERRSIGDLEEMWVQLPAGAEGFFVWSPIPRCVAAWRPRDASAATTRSRPRLPPTCLFPRG